MLDLLDKLPLNRQAAKPWYFRNAFQVNMTLVIANARQINARLKQSSTYIPIEVVMDEIKKRNQDLFRGNTLESAGQVYQPYGYPAQLNNASAFIPLKLLNDEDKIFFEKVHEILSENCLDLADVEKLVLIFAKEKWFAKKDAKPAPTLDETFFLRLLQNRNEDPLKTPSRLALQKLGDAFNTA